MISHPSFIFKTTDIDLLAYSTDVPDCVDTSDVEAMPVTASSPHCVVVAA